MAGDNLLVVLLQDGYGPELRRAIRARSGDTNSVRIVAPAHLSAAQWLASDEDGSRIEAERRALEAESQLRDQATHVLGEAGDADPVTAAKDALGVFPADEILLVAGSSNDGGIVESLAELGLPVTAIPAGVRVRNRRLLRHALRAIARGETQATPFVAFAAVLLVSLAAVILVSLVVALALRLV